ncbi:hypothetical protein Hanom_Chr12g01158861 [Helianthus anomalus]
MTAVGRAYGGIGDCRRWYLRSGAVSSSRASLWCSGSHDNGMVVWVAENSKTSLQSTALVPVEGRGCGGERRANLTSSPSSTAKCPHLSLRFFSEIVMSFVISLL